MDPSRFPILLNARDEDGNVVYADGNGGAFVYKPYPPGYVPPPLPTGASYLGIHTPVPRPASMRHRFFDEHPCTAIYANEARTEALVRTLGGNPPPPPRVVPVPSDLLAS